MDDPALEDNNVASVVDNVVGRVMDQLRTRPQGNQNVTSDVIFPLGCDFEYEVSVWAGGHRRVCMRLLREERPRWDVRLHLFVGFLCGVSVRGAPQGIRSMCHARQFLHVNFNFNLVPTHSGRRHVVRKHGPPRALAQPGRPRQRVLLDACGGACRVDV